MNHRAFLPPADLQLSTFNVDGLQEAEVWSIGDRVRVEQQKETLHGRADLKAKSVYSVGLRPAGKTAHGHPHRQVRAFDVGR